MRDGFELSGRVAVITGAAKGIGRGLALGLAKAGMKLVLGDIDRDMLHETTALVTAAQGTALAVPGDIALQASSQALILTAEREFGCLDVLINNAGVNVSASILELEVAEWQRVLDVNLTAVFRCSQLAARVMAQRGKGAIINIASQLGLVARPGRAAYCVSKAGVGMLTRALAVDLGPYGIRVNALAPGPIEVERTRPMLYNSIEYDSFRTRMLLGRFGQPEDLLGAVVFLASDASNFMTGTTVVVDGGYLAT